LSEKWKHWDLGKMDKGLACRSLSFRILHDLLDAMDVGGTRELGGSEKKRGIPSDNNETFEE
jgi:hypothetical protein